MAKIYSTLFILACFSIPPCLIAQNVGVGTSTPREKLDVAGAIIIGNTTNTGNYTGTIRYNPTTNKFEGRDSTAWIPFGGGGGESLWVPNGVNIYPDTQYNGNVGIGTYIPLAKLHVKGSGITAIKAETTNDTLPTIDVTNITGTALKVTTHADSVAAVWITTDSSIALFAETKSDTLPTIQVLNKDSAGYALKVISWAALDTINGEIVSAEGGNAAHVVGDLNLWGALRNTDSTLYGGSIAVNDGMTVGDIAGASCTPETSVMDSFVKDFGVSFELIYYGRNNNPIYTNTKTFSPTKDCREVTHFYFEPYVGDEQAFPLDFSVWVRDEFIGSVYEPSANLNQNPPLPDYYPDGPLVFFQNNQSFCGCYTSKWALESNVFNGEDPNAVTNNNWYVQYACNTNGDTEYLFAYKGRVYYMWGDSIQAPTYASYGDIRASGAIYANSDELLGDVAEYFKVRASVRKPEPGDLVSISKDNPQTFELSGKEYDPLVVGVVSENPSVYLNKPTEGYPIGLTGRVKVKVNLKGGKIEVGDPITSSSMEGVGMKAGRDGMVIGYALEPFDGSRTNEGKIVIMLSRGHVEKVDPEQVKEVDGQKFGGILVKGATRVNEDENIVFVAWDSKLGGRIPSDVEFEDLFVELTPFGGNAKMIVKDVSAEGITVEITERGAGFEGFYYQTDIVTGMMETLTGDEQPAEDINSATFAAKVLQAKKLYKDWSMTFEELKAKGGISLAPIQKMTNGKQVGLYKKEVVKKWRENVPELFERWQNLGKELSLVVGTDQNLIRMMREM